MSCVLALNISTSLLAESEGRTLAARSGRSGRGQRTAPRRSRRAGPLTWCTSINRAFWVPRLCFLGAWGPWPNCWDTHCG